MTIYPTTLGAYLYVGVGCAFSLGLLLICTSHERRGLLDAHHQRWARIVAKPACARIAASRSGLYRHHG